MRYKLSAAAASNRCKKNVEGKALIASSGAGAVLVVDDDAGCRGLITTVLTRAGYDTEGAATGEQALAAARSARPSLVILDVRLPDVSGYEICRELRDTFGDGLPIFFVSGDKTDALDRAAGLLIGADDYIVKPFDPDELIARVRRHVSPTPASPQPRSDFEALTRRESEILALLADGLGQIEIAHELAITSKTVATHIQRILVKLHVRSRAQAVAVAHRGALLTVLPATGA